MRCERVTASKSLSYDDNDESCFCGRMRSLRIEDSIFPSVLLFDSPNSNAEAALAVAAGGGVANEEALNWERTLIDEDEERSGEDSVKITSPSEQSVVANKPY